MAAPRLRRLKASYSSRRGYGVKIVLPFFRQFRFIVPKVFTDADDLIEQDFSLHISVNG